MCVYSICYIYATVHFAANFTANNARSLIVQTSIFSHSLTAASACQAKFHHSNFKTASLPAIATLDRTLLLLLLIVTSCYSLLDWNQTKRREVGPARRETATFCWPGLWIDPMPRLHRIIDALLHAQSCEGEEKETIDADGRLDHSLHNATCHPSLMAIAERHERHHRCRKGPRPSIIVSTVIF